MSIDQSKRLHGKNIVGSLIYRPDLLAKLLNFLEKKQNELRFDKLISHKFHLTKVNEAFPQTEWNRRQTESTRAVLVP